MCILSDAGRKSICAAPANWVPFVKVKVGEELEIEAANRLVVKGRPPVGKTRVMGMLRITIAETLTEQRWTLEVRLKSPHALAFRRVVSVLAQLDFSPKSTG